MFNKPLTIFGDGKQVRDVLHVDDLIRLFDKYYDSGVIHGVWNVGGGKNNTTSLLELIKKLEFLLHKKISYSVLDWRADDQKVYVSNIRKAFDDLDWEPLTSFDRGLKNLFNWVKNHENEMRIVG